MAERKFNRSKADDGVMTLEDAQTHAGDAYNAYTEIDCVRQLDGPRGSGASREYKVYGRTESVDLSDKHVALFNSHGTFKGSGCMTDPKFWEAVKENDMRSTQRGDFVDEVTALTVVISDNPFPGEIVNDDTEAETESGSETESEAS